jgi:hypothetical protein
VDTRRRLQHATCLLRHPPDFGQDSPPQIQPGGGGGDCRRGLRVLYPESPKNGRLDISERAQVAPSSESPEGRGTVPPEALITPGTIGHKMKQC